jgi:uracil-DNA glycosylase family 4
MSHDSAKPDWNRLQERIVDCQRCDRLRAYCREIARTRRAAFRDQEYWGRPVPNFGDPNGRLLIVGLAPAAHGANRTGRMFTGDRSGDFLYRALHDARFASSPESRSNDDGLTLRDVAVTAAAHCAPPDNKPTPDELANCKEYLDETFAIMRNLQGIVALGKIGFDACLRYYRERGIIERLSDYKFSHGAIHIFPEAPFIIASYHPSQQNTFTGRLTMPMFLDIFMQARDAIS